MSRGHRIIDLALEYRHETGLAYLVSNDGKAECWLPKSLIEYDGRNIFTMPEWLAKREGLI